MHAYPLMQVAHAIQCRGGRDAVSLTVAEK
jgi:hypothetical protein